VIAARRDLLAVVLDTLVPEGDGFPGAGAAAIDHVLATAAASAEIDALLAAGLAKVEQTAGSVAFASLDADHRERVLRRVEQSDPAFFEALLRHTYDGYYSSPTVVARLGLEPGPVHPHGHRIEAAELPDLSRVRARAAMYRPA
jgi:hypothetical protein